MDCCQALSLLLYVLKLAKFVEHVKQLHGFYYDKDAFVIRFDTVITFDADDMKAQRDEVCRLVKEAYPEFNVYVTLDTDVSD